VNFGRLDLKLLLVFDALMIERSVTRAAERVGMSQPALSNALSRLRDFFNDGLFIRSSEGMRPTPRALELAIPVGQALRQLQAAIEPLQFNSRTAHRSFRLALSPHAEMVLLPPLIRRIQDEAPGIDLHIFPKSNSLVLAQLDANEIDFALGAIPNAPSRFMRLDLMQDRYYCIMRPDHPLAGKELTIERYLEAKHLLVHPVGASSNLVDVALKRCGLMRQKTLIISQYATAFEIVANTNFTTTLLGGIYRLFERNYRYEMLVKLAPVEPLMISLFWHEGLTNHPAYDWLRETIRETCMSHSAPDNHAI
jgi:DNA-binding transcriptional LysR family regulator